jgi:hypothetical protein
MVSIETMSGWEGEHLLTAFLKFLFSFSISLICGLSMSLFIFSILGSAFLANILGGVICLVVYWRMPD